MAVIGKDVALPRAQRAATGAEARSTGSGIGRYRHLFWLWLLFVALAMASRTWLAVVALREGLVGPGLLVQAYVGGLLLDAVAGLYFVLPFAFWQWIAPPRLYDSRFGRALVYTGFVIAAIGLLYLIAAEYFFFDEFNARFNYTAVEYLIYPTEVAGNIRDSYPVLRVLAACVVLGFGLVWSLRRPLREGFGKPMGFLRCSLVTIGLVGAATLATATLSLESVQGFSDNRIADEITANGVYSFFSALRNARIDYERYYATLPGTEAAERARKLLAQSNTRFSGPANGSDPLARWVDNSDLGTPRHPHVIFLFEESMGAEFVGSLEGRGWTPNIDRIAADSLSFTQLYASGTRTVRGMEALATSLAPVPPESVVKRSGNEGLFNLATIATANGYSPSFIYGGYGTFDNMNAFFGSNGWHVVDRTDMPKAKFATVWGISDEELFDNALAEFDRQVARGERVFSLVMSTSNHKPFLFPEGIPGVKAKGGGREAGVRYADYAVGRFFDALRQRPWYRDTVLVIAGDHGARVYGRARIPISNYPIPFIVHAPALVEPGRVDTLASQVDIGPTVLGLLHLSYESRLPGRDVLRMAPGDGYAVFNHNRSVALMRGDHVAELDFGRVVRTERYDRRAGELQPAAQDSELERDAMALFQVSWQAFEDNRRRDEKP